MNILFDLITTQLSFGGGSEYIRKVFYSLKEYVSKQDLDIQVIGIIDSSISTYKYADLTPDALLSQGIKVVDLNKENMRKIIQNHGINKIFIGVLQYWEKRYCLSNIDIEIITVIHDMHDEEIENIRLYPYLALFRSPYAIFRQVMAVTLKWIKRNITHRKGDLSIMIDSLKSNKKWKCITVSEYTKQTLIYYYGISEEKIKVLYSPKRIMRYTEYFENEELNQIINNKIKYYLIVSADRPEKNALRTVEAFLRYRQYLRNKGSSILPYILTLGAKRSMGEGHISLPLLSESDLIKAYKNCYALIYPSYFEGFGYPPVEAMKFDKPILASNVTSIPEILDNAPIYFSPFFQSDIFKSLCKLNDGNYKDYTQKSKERYEVISERQNRDLNKLIKLIIKK